MENASSYTFELSKTVNKNAPSLTTTVLENLKTLAVPGKNKIAIEDFSHREKSNITVTKIHNNGLIDTIHKCFQDHHPLTLSVSDFINAIGQGFAYHMSQNSEKLRDQFVSHEGKEKIIIRRDKFVMGEQNDWSTVFGDFGKEINTRVKNEIYDIIVDDTSVATKDSRICSEINLMDCMKGYFEYEVDTLCGIPRITLKGSSEDWENLKKKVQKLKDLNKNNSLLIDFWIGKLTQVVDKIADNAISKSPDLKFWKSIYKYNEESGSGIVNGWILAFFPYLNVEESDEMIKNDFSKSIIASTYVCFDQFPKSMTSLNFIWDYFGEKIDMLFVGGIAGGKWNSKEKSMEIEYSWAVMKKP